jgi:PPOX class probable F420-dependent enzyme
MGISLNAATRRLLDGRNFAIFATINPDGSPQSSPMWIGRDGDAVVFSTVQGRRKHRNILREPRVSVTVIDAVNPYNYVELRGLVTITEDTNLRVDTELSWKYDGRGPGMDDPGAVRLAIRMVVERATGFAARDSGGV